MTTFQERVRYIRKLNKLSQQDFAKAIGISRGYVSRLETEELNVEGRIYMLISSAFNVNENWLRTGEGDPFHCAALSTHDTQEAAKIIESLSPALRRCALEQLRALAAFQRSQEEP